MFSVFTDPDDLAFDTDELKLAALPNAVGVARQFALSLLRKWDLEELSDGCVLVVSELLTNAIKATGKLTVPASYTELHADTPATIALRLVRTARFLVLEVWDSCGDAPKATDPTEADENGRGLVLVAAFTDKWDHYPSAGGKVVWGRFPIPAQVRHRHAGGQR